MINAQHISAKKDSRDALDLPYLKDLAIAHIQELTGRVWTDYNVHDPGVTLIEILAYAITDLGFRTRNRVPSILAAPSRETTPAKSLFGPKEILLCAPVTLRDYAKIFLSVEGVRHAHLVPSRENPDCKGIYDLLVDAESQDAREHDRIRRECLALYHANILKHNFPHPADADASDSSKPLHADNGPRSNRNLCEDLDQVHFLEHTKLRVELTIELRSGTHVNAFVADLVALLRSAVTLTTRRRQVQDMVQEGFPIETIFNGPELPFGRVLDEDLLAAEPIKEIRTSDIVQQIMKMPGVVNIRDLVVVDSYNVHHKWVCPIESGKVPVLDLEHSEIRIFNDADQLVLESNLVHKRAGHLELGNVRASHKMHLEAEPPAAYLNLQDYYSIHHEFPQIYGVGEHGLRDDETPHRKALAKQFKGFLMFFDQVLGNYLAQLSHLNWFYSLESLNQTYFNQPLLELPHGEYTYLPFVRAYMEQYIRLDNPQHLREEWEEFKQTYREWVSFCQERDLDWARNSKSGHKPLPPRQQQVYQYQREFETKIESPYLHAIWEMDARLYSSLEDWPEYLDRRERLLDHLLARFAIDTRAYEVTRADNPERDRNIATKLRVLRAVPSLSRARGLGMSLADFDPQTQAQLKNNLSGVELGLINYLSIRQSRRDHVHDRVGKGLFVGEKQEGDDFVAVGLQEIQVLNVLNEDQAMDLLYRLGCNERNYSLSRAAKALVVKDSEGNPVIHVHLHQRIHKDEVKSKANEVANLLREWGAKYESLHVVEHHLLRPEKQTNSFGFAVYDPSGEKLLFQTARFRRFHDREETLMKLLHLGRDGKNYSFKTLMPHQVAVVIDLGRDVLQAPELYLSERDANLAIERYVRAFDALYERHVSRENDGMEMFRLLENQKVALLDSTDRLRLYYEAGTDVAAYRSRVEGQGRLHDHGNLQARVIIQKEIRLNGELIECEFESRRLIPAVSADASHSDLEKFANQNIAQLKAMYRRNVYEDPSIRFLTHNYEVYEGTHDPYSQIVTLVLPSWAPRFQDAIFRDHVRRLANKELPAHLVVNIQWLPYTAMLRFEAEFTELLQHRHRHKEMLIRYSELESAASSSIEVDERIALRRSIRDLEEEITKLGDSILQILSTQYS